MRKGDRAELHALPKGIRLSSESISPHVATGMGVLKRLEGIGLLVPIIVELAGHNWHEAAWADGANERIIIVAVVVSKRKGFVNVIFLVNRW